MDDARRLLAQELLISLSQIQKQTTQLSKGMESYFTHFYLNYYKESKKNIEKELQRYKENIESIKDLNAQRTKAINNWFAFINDEHERKKVLFPGKFYFRQVRLNKTIQKINEKIYNLTVDNRLIKDKLLAWERDLEKDAIDQIKESDEYRLYGQLIQKKKQYLDDLKYLLPTLSPNPPTLLEIDQLHLYLEKI